MPTPAKLTPEEFTKFNKLYLKLSGLKSDLADKTLGKEISLRNLKAQQLKIEAEYESKFIEFENESKILNSKILDFVNEMNEKLEGNFQYNPITGDITEEQIK